MAHKDKVNKAVAPAPIPSIAFVPEADLNDTIANNRGLPLLSADTLPPPPAGYRPSDPLACQRRLRRFAFDLRAEAVNALEESAGRDIRKELGQFAPSAQRAQILVDKLTQTGELVARAGALSAYASEMDQIAMSDAIIFLESVHQQYENAVTHNASLATSYRALATLFSMRSGAIIQGIARARVAEADAESQEPAATVPGEKTAPVEKTAAPATKTVSVTTTS